MNTLKFLLITDTYPPTPGATGKIVETICHQLIDRGHTADILSRKNGKEEINEGVRGERVYYCAYGGWERIHRKHLSNELCLAERGAYCILTYLRKIWLAFNLCAFPNSEPRATTRWIKRAKSITANNHYDCVIAFFRPYSALDVGYKLKREGIINVFIPYYLDLVEERDCPRFMPFQLFRRKIYEFDNKTVQASDVVVLPKAAENGGFQSFVSAKDKIVYLNFPTAVFKKEKAMCNVSLREKEIIRFLFAGTLDKNFRNPEKTLFILNNLAKRLPSQTIIFDIYGRSNCEAIISGFDRNANFVINMHGLVGKEIIEQKETEADFLVNISNDYKGIVPSKTFELIATGKYILNSITNGDDGSLKFFNGHSLSFNVDDVENGAEIVAEFIKSGAILNVDQDDVIDRCREYTPEYVVDSLLSKLEGINE